MTKEIKRISIRGVIQKKDLIWTANIPLLRISSHAKTPNGCLKNIIKSINELLGHPIALEAKINDGSALFISSDEAQKFLEFIHLRINANADSESIMESIEEFVTEED